jgi:hypothetical protein
MTLSTDRGALQFPAQNAEIVAAQPSR